jgi:cardiolipin synthase
MSRFLSENWLWLATLFDLVLASAVTVHAVLWKRDSRAVISWVGLAWLAPIVGVFAYFCFGINRIQRNPTVASLRRLKLRHARPLPAGGESRSSAWPNRSPDPEGMVVLGDRLTGRRLLPGNRVQHLIDGDEAYPLMLDSIRRAGRSVTLLSYIFDHDRAGKPFLDALADAQKRGVAVRVLVDDVGSRYGRPNVVREMRKAGLPVASFLPTAIPLWPKYTNLRNHRKILVVDGRVGFTGGTNIREGHWLSLAPTAPVRCVHFVLEGPVVAHLQETFATDWEFTTGEALTGDLWFPDLHTAGPVHARGITGGPDDDFEKLVDTLIGALAVARRSVRIVTPYFLPDGPLIKALTVAALRGVEVEILLPETNNIRLVQWAATAQLWQMLEKGCRVFYTPPPFDHTKLMTVDDGWALIGSTNWDPRSLRLNFEFNVECYDEALAHALNEVIDAKRTAARPVALAEVDGRSLPVRLRDGLARLLSPYL